MDSDPYSNNSFIEINKVKPFISFKNKNSIKTFETVSLNDESETLIFSEINFSENYEFLKSEMTVFALRTEEYMAIKKTINNGLHITELKNYSPEFAIKTNLLMTQDNISLTEDGKEIPYYKRMLDNLVLDDLKPTNQIDRINNYIINYSTKLSTSIFREIEANELRKNIRVIDSKQKIKIA